MNTFLEHDAPVSQIHATSLSERSKLVNAVAAWATLIYGEPHKLEFDDEIANNLVEGFDIDIHTIRALKVKLNHLVEFDPWLTFERLGIVAQERTREFEKAQLNKPFSQQQLSLGRQGMTSSRRPSQSAKPSHFGAHQPCDGRRALKGR